jgi:hypothetical protein
MAAPTVAAALFAPTMSRMPAGMAAKKATVCIQPRQLGRSSTGVTDDETMGSPYALV